MASGKKKSHLRLKSATTAYMVIQHLLYNILMTRLENLGQVSQTWNQIFIQVHINIECIWD